MSGLIAAVLGPVGRWILAAAAVIGAFLAIRRSGERAGRAEVNNEVLEDTKHAMAIRKAAERDLSAAGDAELDEWLRTPERRRGAERER